MKYKVEKRNAEIVQKSNSGASCKEIASKFGLSRNRIQQIVSRHKIDVERKERSSKLLSKLKMVDNIAMTETLPFFKQKNSQLKALQKSMVLQLNKRKRLYQRCK